MILHYCLTTYLLFMILWLVNTFFLLNVLNKFRIYVMFYKFLILISYFSGAKIEEKYINNFINCLTSLSFTWIPLHTRGLYSNAQATICWAWQLQVSQIICFYWIFTNHLFFHILIFLHLSTCLKYIDNLLYYWSLIYSLNYSLHISSLLYQNDTFSLLWTKKKLTFLENLPPL